MIIKSNSVIIKSINIILADINFKRIISFFLICFLFQSYSIAMQRIDDSTALQDSRDFAKNFPYATGTILSKDGNSGSVIFLNETTALTSAHAFIGREKTAHIVIADDTWRHWGQKNDSKFNWEMTFSKLKESGAAWQGVKSQHPLTKFKETELDIRSYDPFELTPTFFQNIIEERENCADEKFISELSKISIGEKTYKITGSDISVVKLRGPIMLSKKPFILQKVDFEKLSKMPAYSFGIPCKQMTSDGKVHDITYLNKQTIYRDFFQTSFLANDLKANPNCSHFYSKLYSYAGMDEQFICDGLSLPQNDQRFIGLMMGGMSGGPLVFKMPSGDYILGGMNKQVINWDIRGLLDAGISAIEELKDINNVKDHEIINQWTECLKKFYKTPFPIYNVFQAFTSEIIDEIHKIMG